MLLGYSRGSVGDVTFAKIKGQQIARARNRNPHNPRTAKQSLQRAIFASAVKFYTRGVQAFYKFAFEGKRQIESDYNAFMRENVRRAMPVSREGINVYDYPVIAPFVMSKGSLQPVDANADNGTAIVNLGIAVPATIPTTVGALTSHLIASDAYAVGDILTLVRISSDYAHTYPSVSASESVAPKWTIKQIILDTTSTETLADTLGVTAQATGEEGAQTLALVGTTTAPLFAGTYAAFTLVHSRNTSSGLKTSTQELVLNAAAITAYEASQTADFKASVIASWQAEGSVDAQPEAILQGSVAWTPTEEEQPGN